MENQEQQYIKGFNDGYLMTTHAPELADAVLNATRNSKTFDDYREGFSTGHDVAIIDRMNREREKDELDPVGEPESLTPEQKYIRGFNSGYVLVQHEPEFAAKITAHPNDKSEYFSGLVGGKQQYEREQGQELLNRFARRTPAKDDREIDKDLDKER